MRALKRRLSDVVYRQLAADAHHQISAVALTEELTASGTCIHG